MQVCQHSNDILALVEGNVARTYRVNEVEATFDLAGRAIAIASIERSAVSYNSSLGVGPYKASHLSQLFAGCSRAFTSSPQLDLAASSVNPLGDE